MANQFYSFAKKVLRLDEGVKSSPYLDTKGLWTIGVGHLIGSDLKRLSLPETAIDAMLDEDIEIHLDLVVRVFGKEFFNSVEVARQVGLFSLVFNMGPNIYSFKNTIGLIKERRWTEAANNLRASKWARDVDPKNRAGIGRDDRVIAMIEFGIFDKAYQL
jgi:lysozyme